MPWNVECFPHELDVACQPKDAPQEKFLSDASFCQVAASLCLEGTQCAGPHNARTQIMQRVTLVRYTTKSDHSAENEVLSRAVFAQLRSAPPEGVAYALFRDGNEFIHVFLNLKADESAPVTDLPAFKMFEKGIVERCEVPPNPTRLAAKLVDHYGFVGDAAY
jgi:hypothetical protein